MPLSKADVSQALVVMHRFDRWVEVDDITVNAWFMLLEPEISEPSVLRAAVLRTYSIEKGRVTPAHIIEHAADIIYETNIALEEQHEKIRQVAVLKIAVKELGYTLEQYTADEAVKEKVIRYAMSHDAELTQQLNPEFVKDDGRLAIPPSALRNGWTP